MQLKRWESPRREGRNDQGKGGSARKRQLKKQRQMLRQRLKESKKADNSTSKVIDKGKIYYSSPFFLGVTLIRTTQYTHNSKIKSYLNNIFIFIRKSYCYFHEIFIRKSYCYFHENIYFKSNKTFNYSFLHIEIQSINCAKFRCNSELCGYIRNYLVNILHEVVMFV